MNKLHLRAAPAVFSALVLMPLVFGQTPSPRGGGAGAPAPQAPSGRAGRGPMVTSPEVLPDRHITFRILAPQAQNVRVSGGDIPALAVRRPATRSRAGGPPPGQMTKGENGVWEVTIGPIDPGAYRYNFNVDGVTVIDPRNPSISESNTNVWSLVYVPGSDFMDTKEVPHGAVASA